MAESELRALMREFFRLGYQCGRADVLREEAEAMCATRENIVSLDEYRQQSARREADGG